MNLGMKYWGASLSQIIIIYRAGHFRYFLNFFNNKKWFFAYFIKLIWLGVGFLNRTGAENGY